MEKKTGRAWVIITALRDRYKEIRLFRARNLFRGGVPGAWEGILGQGRAHRGIGSFKDEQGSAGGGSMGAKGKGWRRCR